MISTDRRIAAFVGFSEFLRAPENDSALGEWAEAAYRANNWFVPRNVRYALESIAAMLADPMEVLDWFSAYPAVSHPRKIGVVLAGNIPAVGFHDLLCVLISGHRLLVKPSKDDSVLIRLLLDTLCRLEPGLAGSVEYVERINAADAYIATGSDNTARYFEYYFASKPHLIRRNRVSVGVLSGRETAAELDGLCSDIFCYYGLGCRNVSKLFVPRGYDFSPLLEQAGTYRDYAAHHHKYFNNYEYNKSILLVNGEPHLDNGYLLLRESRQLASPLSVVHYEQYESLENVADELVAGRDKIQCVVSGADLPGPVVGFGESQRPGLSDYADSVDVMDFLSRLP